MLMVVPATLAVIILATTADNGLAENGVQVAGLVVRRLVHLLRL
jgi:hypothetical protein